MPTKYRRRRPTRPREKGQRALIVFVVIIVILLLLYTFFNMRIRPLVVQMGTSRVSNLATRAINNAVNDEVASGNIDYDKLIGLEKDVDGKVTALKTNMVEVNRLKAEITNKVIDYIESSDTTEISIPIGNVVSSNLFSGRGPKIQIKIVAVSSASASFENVFTSAGINQTRHQIILNVTVRISILLAGYSTSTTVESSISVAETVIIGTVPESYTYFERAASVEDDIEDYLHVN